MCRLAGPPLEDNSIRLHFTELITLYGDDIWTYFYVLTKDSYLASDLTQDTFEKALRGLTSFRGESAIRTWLYRIARNVGTDYFRSALFRKIKIQEDLEQSSSSTVEDEALMNIGIRHIWSKILRLKRTQREIIVLHLRNDFTFEEVATVLSIQASTVRTRYRRGIQELRRLIEEETNNDTFG